MSVGTVNLKVRLDARRFRWQTAGARTALAFTGLRFNAAWYGLGDQERARRELALARKLQTSDPALDAQCVTTNEGRCRVVIRRLGGWA